MTPCQACHEREAVVHLTQVEGDAVTTVHLCGRCAAERGVATEAEAALSPLGAFLATVGKGGAPLAKAAATESTACPGCGATLADFRASGRVGCPACWTTFERPLAELLRRVHGATRHAGKRYVDPALAPDPDLAAAEERTRLREALRQAIADEAFEQAAELRDRLRALGEGA